jgi:transposase
VLDGIFYILRTGAPCYGPYISVYNRFNRRAKAGVWGRVFEALARGSPASLRLIDSSIVRAHQHSAGAKTGLRSDRAVALRADDKVHALVDHRGLPLRAKCETEHGS